jgi:hypothetical protein
MKYKLLVAAVVVVAALSFACGGGNGGGNSITGPGGSGNGVGATDNPTPTPTPTETPTPTAVPTGEPTATPTETPSGPDLNACSADGATGATQSSLTFGYRWWANRETTVTTTVTLAGGAGSCSRTDSGSDFGAACKITGLAKCTSYTATYSFTASDGSSCSAPAKSGFTKC